MLLQAAAEKERLEYLSVNAFLEEALARAKQLQEEKAVQKDRLNAVQVGCALLCFEVLYCMLCYVEMKSDDISGVQEISGIREQQRASSEQYDRLAKRFRDGLLNGVNADQFHDLADAWETLNARLRELERGVEDAGEADAAGGETRRPAVGEPELRACHETVRCLREWLAKTTELLRVRLEARRERLNAYADALEAAQLQCFQAEEDFKGASGVLEEALKRGTVQSAESKQVIDELKVCHSLHSVNERPLENRSVSGPSTRPVRE